MPGVVVVKKKNIAPGGQPHAQVAAFGRAAGAVATNVNITCFEEFLADFIRPGIGDIRNDDHLGSDGRGLLLDGGQRAFQQQGALMGGDDDGVVWVHDGIKAVRAEPVEALVFTEDVLRKAQGECSKLAESQGQVSFCCIV